MFSGRQPQRLVVEVTDTAFDTLPSIEARSRVARDGAPASRADRMKAALQASADLPLSVIPQTFIDRSSSVYTIGSCFAVNIRRVLRERGLSVHPHTDAVELDPDRQHIGRHRNLNHYDTFTIRQEIERALDPGAAGFEPLASKIRSQEGFEPPDGRCYQDAARMHVYGIEPDDVIDLQAKLDACTRQALDTADVIIISLGLIETWRDRATGRHAWASAVGTNAVEDDRVAFHLSTYEENLDNVRWVCRALADHRPEAEIVLTVSPVGLGRTFSGKDITVANTYSKSLLRAVAGAIDLEFPAVHYWPSYEIATRANLFSSDLRHVTDDGVEFIIGRFLEAHAEL